jgi:hypothetical protein
VSQTWQYIFNKEIPKKQFYIISNIKISIRADKQFDIDPGVDNIKYMIFLSSKADSLLVIEKNLNEAGCPIYNGQGSQIQAGLVKIFLT